MKVEQLGSGFDFVGGQISLNADALRMRAFAD